MASSSAASSASGAGPKIKPVLAAPSSLIDPERYIRIKEEGWKCEYIADNYSEDEERRGGLIYLPEGQRNWAWKNKKGTAKMEKLVDSLMHNYPVPSSIVNLVNGRYQIYDGRHRMETIWRFRNNKFQWNGRLYKDLCQTDRERFDNRVIPVSITYAPKGEVVSTDQLADIFIRLNSGQQLTDSDMLWAYRDTAVMRGVRSLIIENRRLKAVFGDIDMNYRPDLANWASYYCGLGTNNSGNFTTSYIRIDELGLNKPLNEESVSKGMEALCILYEQANARFPASTKDLRTFKKIGFVNAFFLADWMSATSSAMQNYIIAKWLDIIGRLRGDTKSAALMRSALHTTGAQNLTTKKIETVLQQVNRFLTENEVEEADDSDEESE
jgi:hypothetical protein